LLRDVVLHKCRISCLTTFTEAKNCFELSMQRVDGQRLYKKMQKKSADMNVTFLSSNYFKYNFNAQKCRLQ